MEDHDWDKIFQDEINNKIFYQTLKNQKVLNKEQNSPQLNGIIKYYQSQGMNKSKNKIDNTLLQYFDKTLFIYEKNVTEEQSDALQKYLEIGASNQQMQIRTLIIDSCYMQDVNLAKLLAAISSQIQDIEEINDYGKIESVKKYHFFNFVCSNNQFGYESLQ